MRARGIIAMRREEVEAIVDVRICTEQDGVLLAAAMDQCIRFPVPHVRVFPGRKETRRRQSSPKNMLYVTHNFQ